MICILRVLKFVPSPITGWDKLPQENDNSIGANLTRIKVYRNMLCHTSKARINDKAFQKIWSTLTHVSFTSFTLIADFLYGRYKNSL